MMSWSFDVRVETYFPLNKSFVLNTIACANSCSPKKNKTVKKTFFGKKTIITNGFSGFKIKSYTYKEYGLVFKFSKEYSDEISSEIVVTDIEIFDNTNLEVKRSKQYYRYNDQIFDSINQQTIIKIFGNSFVKKETEKTVCYTFLDRKISFIFNKVNNNCIVVSIANNKL